ncbi:MAG TPA: DUF3303 family protein [Zeimonas sp.]
MLFMTLYRILPGKLEEAIDRFGHIGNQIPQGVELLGRWHDPGSHTGVTISQCDDQAALARFQLQWVDLMELQVRPVLDDKQLAALLAERAQ